MRSAAASVRRVVAPAALLAVFAGCESAGMVAPADAPASAPPAAQAGMVFELSPRPPAEGEAADACAGPLSSRYVLADGRWRSETRWPKECVDQTAQSDIVTFAGSGTYELLGDEITLHIEGSEDPEFSEDHGVLTSESLVIWGHCDGETVYTRVFPERGS